MTVRWTSAVIGAIVAGTITAGMLLYTSTSARQETTARELLSEVIALVSLKEGWLLQGEGSRTAKLSDKPGLPEAESGSGLWLLPVEIRVILDEAQWNSPSDQSYGFIQGRRVWIIRNEILPDDSLSYSGFNQEHFPALISSAGMQELCAWIERMAVETQHARMCQYAIASEHFAVDDRIEADGPHAVE